MAMSRSIGSFCLIAVLFAAGSLFAQSPQGTITGTITDPQGARVPGVEVIALRVDTNHKFTGLSSNDGTYVIPALPIGKYEISATLTGFSTYKQTGVVLEVGQRLRIDIGLQIGSVTETVLVSGEVSRVQTESSSAGTTVEQQRIANLPLNGRHVLDLVKLIPGVQAQNRATDGFAQVDNQGFSQTSFNGGPTYGNQIFLDGGMNTVPVHSELSVVPMLDRLEEFKVLTNALPAEFGQSNGGVINIVTRGGTKQLRGSLYEFVRNDVMDARNAFLTTRDPITGRIKPVVRYNRSSNFDPFVTNSVTNTPGAMLYAGVTKDRHFTNPPNYNFTPRIGFAYNITGDGKTAVHGGYAIIYGMLESGDTAGDTANSLGFSIDTTFVAPGGGVLSEPLN